MLSSGVWFVMFLLLGNCLAVVYPLQNICYLVGSVLLCTVAWSLKKAVADPSWVWSTIAQDIVCADFCVVLTTNKLETRKKGFLLACKFVWISLYHRSWLIYVCMYLSMHVHSHYMFTHKKYE